MGLKIRLESVVTNTNHIHSNTGIKSNTGPRSSTISDINKSSLGGVELPNNWIAEIGVGKEWDKVVGYWRFSDLFHEGELGFCNSGTPGARGVFLDLSKYGNPLEVFGGADRNLQVQDPSDFQSVFNVFFLVFILLFSLWNFDGSVFLSILSYPYIYILYDYFTILFYCDFSMR